MGRKHSKNAGVMGSESLSYHERKALGFGTVTERMGKVGRQRSAPRRSAVECPACRGLPRVQAGPGVGER